MNRHALQVIEQDDELDEIIDGLSRPEKMISPKFFYDERGSQLFEAITRLPEYYPTETELGIMRANVGEIARLVGKQASLIEFGSGSSLKTRILLQHLNELAAYVPVDISEDHLLEAAAIIGAEFPGIEVLPVVADFTQPFGLPSPATMPLRNLVYFPGSTIGNFTHEDALALLKVMYQEAGEDGALLIGVDLQKNPDIIYRAYNDSEGVTAEFNLNMLRHLNREFGADFDLDAYEHSAEYNEERGRIEMRLVSGTDQEFTIGNASFSIDRDEAILTEYSHKYTLDGFAAMAAAADFRVEHVWMDEDRLFSVQYLVRDYSQVPDPAGDWIVDCRAFMPGIRCSSLLRRQGHLSPSWLPSVRFTSVDKRPGPPLRVRKPCAETGRDAGDVFRGSYPQRSEA